MLKRILAAGLFSGLAAGALAALLQLTFVVPLIQEGELYESGQISHFAGVAEAGHADDHDHDHGAEAEAHDHGEEEGEETPLFQRHALTFGTFLIGYTGFALILIAGFSLAEARGHRVTARSGLVWGLAAFVTVQLAPAFGLPPEIPGASAAALHLRQIWWVGCVLATGAGLALIAFGGSVWTVAAAIVLIAAPHVIGAPHAAYGGVAPPELAAHFAARVLGAGAACFALLGVIAGAIWSRSRDGRTA